MARIIDLGNGYGRLENYGSPYDILIFPLTPLWIRKLLAEGSISDDEARDILSEMGYSLPETKRLIAVGKVTAEQWKARVHSFETI